MSRYIVRVKYLISFYVLHTIVVDLPGSRGETGVAGKAYLECSKKTSTVKVRSDERSSKDKIET